MYDWLKNSREQVDLELDDENHDIGISKGPTAFGCRMSIQDSMSLSSTVTNPLADCLLE